MIKDTKYKISSKNSCYDRKNDTIYLLKDSDKYEVLHEIGHVIETKLDVLHNDEYIKIQKNGLEDVDLAINSETLKEYNDNMFIKNTGKFNTRTLGEYFSEGFRCYFEDNKLLKSKDIELYNYIKEILR